MLYLALRHSRPKSFFHRIFDSMTRIRLVTNYPHAGVAMFGSGGIRLLHTNLAKGLHSQDLSGAEIEGWHFVALPKEIELSVNVRFFQRMRSGYDWFSLLAFVLPWRVSDSSRMYCFEWCWYAMTGENPSFRVTAEMLLAKAAEMNGVLGKGEK